MSQLMAKHYWSEKILFCLGLIVVKKYLYFLVTINKRIWPLLIRIQMNLSITVYYIYAHYSYYSISFILFSESTHLLRICSATAKKVLDLGQQLLDLSWSWVTTKTSTRYTSTSGTILRLLEDCAIKNASLLEKIKSRY